jgi:uncharacterized protein YaaR (DUF327 family)
MDRIESLDSPQFSGRSRRKKAQPSRLPRVSPFSAFVEEAAEEEEYAFDLESRPDGRKALEAILDEVHERGERLVQSPTIAHIKEYRKAVQGFLDFVVRHLLTVEEKTSGSNVKKRKRFTQVRMIDQRLEQLVTAVLQNQGKQLDMLERVNEIQGLLVNLIT